MCDCTDEEMAEARHGLSRRERLERDPSYADWVYEQEKDVKMCISEARQLLIEQLKIVIEHCNETGLRAGAGAVGEAIKIIRKEGV